MAVLGDFDAVLRLGNVGFVRRLEAVAVGLGRVEKGLTEGAEVFGLDFHVSDELVEGVDRGLALGLSYLHLVDLFVELLNLLQKKRFLLLPVVLSDL